jgi:hypothetical protein
MDKRPRGTVGTLKVEQGAIYARLSDGRLIAERIKG